MLSNLQSPQNDFASKASFPIPVLTRLASVEMVAGANAVRLDAITPRTVKNEYAALVSSVVKSKRNLDSKLLILWQAADLIGKYALQVSACRHGCSHCCHTPVAISAAEAALIGARIKKAPRPVTLRQDELAKDGIGQPCVFLHEGRCSIYKNRPLSCRTHFNLDEDGLLCELVEGEEIPVPYLDSRSISIAYAAINPEGLATLNEFFGD